jgi:integrase
VSTLFRQIITRYHGPDGKRCKSTTPGAKKTRKRSAKYYVQLPGDRSPTPLHANKSRATVMLARLLEERSLPDHEKQRARPIAEHLADFEAHVRSSPKGKRGGAPGGEYVAGLMLTVRRAVEACGAKLAGDLTRDGVQAHLAALAAGGEPPLIEPKQWRMVEVAKFLDRHEEALRRAVRRYSLAVSGKPWKRTYPAETVLALWLLVPLNRGLGSASIRRAVGQLRRFGRWLADRCDWRRSPLESLKAPAAADGRHARRALTAAELAALLDAAAASPRVVAGLTGADRRALYVCALATGFRRGELAALRPGSFRLDSPSPSVVLPGSADKRGRAVEQPVPPAAAAELRAYLEGLAGAGRDSGAPVWGERWVEYSATILMRDLAEAGVPYTVPGPDGLLFCDFHALRHTFIALLDRAGLSLKQAMELARHSDPRLTAKVYGRANAAELAAAAARVSIPGVVTEMVTGGTAIEGESTLTNTDKQAAGGDRNRARKPKPGKGK